MAKRLGKRVVREALLKANGVYTVAAKLLDCDRRTVARFVDRNQDLLDDIEEARSRIVDLAENKLFNEINEGNLTAVIFALKTLGKSRGYIERAEHTGADGGPLHDLEGFGLAFNSALDRLLANREAGGVAEEADGS